MYAFHVVKKATAEAAYKNAQKSLAETGDTLLLYKQADEVLRRLVELLHDESIGKVESLITNGLCVIFQTPLQFKIRTVTKRGNLQYEMYLVEDGKECSIVDSFGGGVVAVVSILLRIITILIVRPKMERVLFLDESLANLSRQYVPQAADFLKKLGGELGFKILMITHDPLFVEHADNVYEVTKDGPYAKVVEMNLKSERSVRKSEEILGIIE